MKKLLMGVALGLGWLCAAVPAFAEWKNLGTLDKIPFPHNLKQCQYRMAFDNTTSTYYFYEASTWDNKNAAGESVAQSLHFEVKYEDILYLSLIGGAFFNQSIPDTYFARYSNPSERPIDVFFNMLRAPSPDPNHAFFDTWLRYWYIDSTTHNRTVGGGSIVATRFRLEENCGSSTSRQ